MQEDATLLTGDDLCCRIDKRSSVEEDGRRGAENHPGPAATGVLSCCESPSSRPSGPLSPSSAHIIGLDLRRSLLIGSPASLASLGDGDDQTLLAGDDADGSSSDGAPFGGRVEDMSDLMLLIARLQLPSAQKVQQPREWSADRSRGETGVVRRSSSARGRSVSIDSRPPERIFTSVERDFHLPADPEHLPGIVHSRAVERSIASRRITPQPVLTVVSPNITSPTSLLTDIGASEPDDAGEFFDAEDHPFWMTSTPNAFLNDEVRSYPTADPGHDHPVRDEEDPGRGVENAASSSSKRRDPTDSAHAVSTSNYCSERSGRSPVSVSGDTASVAEECNSTAESVGRSDPLPPPGEGSSRPHRLPADPPLQRDEAARASDECSSPIGAMTTLAQLFPRKFGRDRVDQELIQVLAQSLKKQIVAAGFANIGAHEHALALARAELQSDVSSTYCVEVDDRCSAAHEGMMFF